jgi:hypothetical protein
MTTLESVFFYQLGTTGDALMLTPEVYASIDGERDTGNVLLFRFAEDFLREDKVFVWCLRHHTKKFCLQCDPTASVPQNHRPRL